MKCIKSKFMKKPKYLFLDIDSVLNCYSDSEQLFISEIEKKSNPNFKIYKSADFVSCNKLRLLQEIVTQTGCLVIGISSWFVPCRDEASLHSRAASGFNSLRDPKDIGDFLDITIHSVAECTGGGLGRTKSIQKFLSENEHQSFVVLDDQQEGHHVFGENHVMPVREGLTEELKLKCIELLGEK